MKQSLKSKGDIYNGFKVGRVNTNFHKPDIIVKYWIEYKNVKIYFQTQEDVMKYIDTITN